MLDIVGNPNFSHSYLYRLTDTEVSTDIHGYYTNCNHYENLPMQYTEIFSALKIEN